jgi:hypothetical protein
VHNGVPNEIGVPDDEVKDSDPARAASIEGGGVSPQRLDETGNLIRKSRYRNFLGTSDVAP